MAISRAADIYALIWKDLRLVVYGCLASSCFSKIAPYWSNRLGRIDDSHDFQKNDGASQVEPLCLFEAADEKAAAYL